MMSLARQFPVRILTGPTGSGKSRVALEVADRLNAEIIAMDSMTLYRGMDIGTAKPTVADRQRIAHHLLDVLDPWESATVAWWLKESASLCADISSRGKTILFVGGTALYLKALLHGLFDAPAVDEHLRCQLESEAKLSGPEGLHLRLSRVDPISAARLHPNDVRRVVRALEIWHQTGRPMSAWQQEWQKESEGLPAHSCLRLDLPRELLYARIDARVDEMMEAGLLEEVRQLQNLHRPLGREARQALGYKELLAHLEGSSSLEEAIEEIKTRTRQFAKRQLTWFRQMPECQPVHQDQIFLHWSQNGPQ